MYGPLLALPEELIKAASLFCGFRGVITLEPRLFNVFLEELVEQGELGEIPVEGLSTFKQFLLENGLLTPLTHNLRDTEIYRLTPFLPQFIRRHIDDNTQEVIQKGFIGYYNLLSQKLRVDLVDNNPEVRAIADEFIAIEKENFLSALWISPDKSPTAFTHILGVIFRQLTNHKQFHESLWLCQQLLESHTLGKIRLATDRTQLGLVYYYLGISFSALSAFDEAIRYLALARDINSQEPQRNFSIELEIAKILVENLAYERAIPHLRQLISTFEDPQFANELIQAYELLATVYERSQEPIKAISLLEKASNSPSFSKVPLLRANILDSQGRLQFNQRNYPQAEEAFKESLSIHALYRSKLLEVGMIQVNIGLCRAAVKDYEEAKKRYHQAMEIFISQDQAARTAGVFHNLSNLAIHEGELDDALYYAEQALTHYQDERSKADVYYNKGIIFREKGNKFLEKSVEWLLKAREIYESRNVSHSLEAVNHEVSRSHLLMENWQEAIHFEEEAFNTSILPRGKVQSALDIAWMYQLQQSEQEAASWMQVGLTIAHEIQDEDFHHWLTKKLAQWKKEFPSSSAI